MITDKKNESKSSTSASCNADDQFQSDIILIMGAKSMKELLSNKLLKYFKCSEQISNDSNDTIQELPKEVIENLAASEINIACQVDDEEPENGEVESVDSAESGESNNTYLLICMACEDNSPLSCKQNRCSFQVADKEYICNKNDKQAR